MVADNFETGEASYRYFIIERPSQETSPSRSNSGSSVYTEIFFKGKVNEHFQTGKKIKVRGKRRSNGRGIDFGSLELLEPEPEPEPGKSSQAPVASPEVRKVLTLVVDFNDAVVYDYATPANTPNGATVQNVKDLMFHETKNVSHFYNMASLGTLTIPSDPNSLSEDAVYGPYQIDYNYLGGDPNFCDSGTWVLAALDLWEEETGQSRADYHHYSLVIPNWSDYSNRNCSFGGQAVLGCSTSCWAVNADPLSSLHGVIAHEIGHNFGFQHARTDIDNDGNAESEYGDRSDMMGGSRNWMKFNPPHFEFNGWNDPVTYELRTITPSSTPQLFDLLPVDEEDTEWPGLRALKTNRDEFTSYYLSYRQQTGHYNNVTSSYTTGASLHWREDTGWGANASYFIRMIDPGDVFVDATADLVVWGVGPMTVDNPEFTDKTQMFTLKVCNTTCSILLRPLNLVARGIYADSIELTWQDYTYNEDGFIVEYSQDGSEWSTLGTALANAVSYVHSGLDAGNTFYYRVRAYRGASESSDWSVLANATTSSINPSIAPDLTPETDTGVSDNDNITTDSTPAFYVTCSGIGNNINLYTDNPATYPGMGTHICETTGTETVTATTALAVGNHQIVYTEKIGNLESGNSPSLAITVDPPALSDHFVTTWQTYKTGTSNSTSIKVPMIGGPYDVDWDNDGTFDQTGLTGSVTHNFGAVGTYTIRIRGAYKSIRFDYSGDKEKILSLDQWGTNSWTTMNAAFSGATNLTIPATDIPNFTAVTDMSLMFLQATSANPDVSGWDTSSVTRMSHMFSSATSANPNISSWDTSAVTDMLGMFSYATSASPDVSDWDTSSVTRMSFMFQNATSANPNISNWDTSAVTGMNRMFDGATSFDQDAGLWDVTALTDAFNMFNGVTISTANYDSLLIGWASQELQNGVGFSGGDSKYCSPQAIAARAKMIASDSWVITDGGQQICPPLTQPTNINATDGTFADHTRISWNAALGATGYRVYRCTGTSAGSCGAAIGFPAGTSFDDLNGTAGTNYYYRVKACSNGMCSAFSLADKGFRMVAEEKKMWVNRFLSFDTDGKDDVLLRNTETGRWEINFMNNRWVKPNSGPTWLFPSPDWEMMGIGDFNGNGRGDILLRNRVTGGWWIFLMNGRNHTSGKTLITTNMDWQMAGLGDFDGDGKDDVLLRNRITGRWQINFMNNRWIKPNSGPTWLFPSLDWEMMATGDFNGNDRADILLRNKVTGGWWMFIMNGRHFTSDKTLLTRDLNWQITGVDDFDGDHKDDVLIRNVFTGEWIINFMNNRWIKPNSGPTWLFPSLDWEMMGTGDFNGNGRGDILLRNKVTGGWWIFMMNGRLFTSGRSRMTLDEDWQVSRYAGDLQAPPGELQDINLEQNDVLSYSLAFISGEYPFNDSKVIVSNGDITTTWPIYKGRYKALVRLQPGENILSFKFPNETRTLTLNFEPTDSPKDKMRLFYYLGSDGSGAIDAPPGVPNDISEAMKRMKLGALMLQTFFAESYKRSRESQMGVSNLPRKTFHLELDENGEPIVHIIRSPSTQAELWNLNNGGENFAEVVRLLYAWERANGEVPDDFVHMGRSGIAHLDPVTGIYKAGVCLGSGGIRAGVGMCHAANMITHAPSINEVTNYFTDNQPFDPTYIIEDSQNRGNNWGAYAATFGGLMHEAGHALSLPHTNTGMMASDFGSINRFFTVYEVQPDGSRLPITEENELRHAQPFDWWHPDSVDILETSPFIY